MRAAITTLEPGRRFATTSDDSEDRASSGVTLRAFPYPYKAALAVCSDLDETPTLDDYVEMSRFLNTYDSTRLGHGVGLEIGNSIYFDMPRDQFSYWNASEPGRNDWARRGHRLQNYSREDVTCALAIHHRSEREDVGSA